MSTLPLRASALAAAFVSLTAALLPLTAGAQTTPAANIQWSSYFGGTDADRISAVAQLGGYAVAVGVTRSSSLLPNAASGTRSSPDVFVARFESDVGRMNLEFPILVFGGNGVDEPAAVAVGENGALYIVGRTTSTTFDPSVEVRGTTMAAGDNGFLARILPTGELDWFMILGGSAADTATGVTVIGPNVYVTGSTTSNDLLNVPTLVPAGTNGFVTRIDINQAGNPSIGWGLQPLIIGGEGTDTFHGITASADNKLYVAGTTSSAGFTYGPKVMGTFQGGGTDALVAQFDAESANMYWLTYVGGSGADQGNAIATGASQSFVMAGTTSSPGNLGTGPALGNTQAFVAWILPSGQLKFSEVRQGSGNDAALAVATDSNGNAYVGGRTVSADFQGVPANGFDLTLTNAEGFVWMAPPEGGAGWASFVGGAGADEVTSLSVREQGSDRLILGLQTDSPAAGMPGPPAPGTAPAYDGSLSGGTDGYLLTVSVRDISPPVQGMVFDRLQQDSIHEDVATTTSTTSLFANWTGFFDTSAIVKYEWALGTRTDPTSLQRMTSVNQNTSGSATTLTLVPGQEYIATVRATNIYGLTRIATSDGVLVTYDDGGVPEVPDSGTDIPDGGVDTPDGGADTPDSGAGTPDAGSDGGTEGPGDGGGGGGDGDGQGPNSPVGWDLGCASGGGAAPLFLSLLALVLLGRRLRAR